MSPTYSTRYVGTETYNGNTLHVVAVVRNGGRTVAEFSSLHRERAQDRANANAQARSSWGPGPDAICYGPARLDEHDD